MASQHELQIYLTSAESVEELHSYIHEVYDDLVQPGCAQYESVPDSAIRIDDILLLPKTKHMVGAGSRPINENAVERHLGVVLGTGTRKCSCNPSIVLEVQCLKDGSIYGTISERKEQASFSRLKVQLVHSTVAATCNH